jgi:hypothetical protein
MQVIEGSSIEYAGIHITIDIWGPLASMMLSTSTGHCARP